MHLIISFTKKVQKWHWQKMYETVNDDKYTHWINKEASIMLATQLNPLCSLLSRLYEDIFLRKHFKI